MILKISKMSNLIEINKTIYIAVQSQHVPLWQERSISNNKQICYKIFESTSFFSLEEIKDQAFQPKSWRDPKDFSIAEIEIHATFDLMGAFSDRSGIEFLEIHSAQIKNWFHHNLAESARED